jgi:GNAT superfamily N-acetyltransferase
VARAREAISSEEVLVVLVRPTAPAASPSSSDETLRVCRLSAVDAPAYADAIGTDSPSTFRARLSDASRCYGVELSGRLVHASWVTTDCAWTRELRAFICPPAGDAYVYESFTRDDARGRGVYPFALNGICAELHAEEIARLWVAVESHNAASLRAVDKAGFEPVLEISYRRRLGRLTVSVPDAVKSDSRATAGSKKHHIWLSGDGAQGQGKP